MANLTNATRGVVGQLLAVLNTRNRDVISRRFGLKTGKKETLESIGQSYGITHGVAITFSGNDEYVTISAQAPDRPGRWPKLPLLAMVL